MITSTDQSKSVKILILRCKVREKIGKKSVIFADFDFIFFIFHEYKIQKKIQKKIQNKKNHGVKIKKQYLLIKIDIIARSNMKTAYN